jgi:predicted small integral membrane protein
MLGQPSLQYSTRQLVQLLGRFLSALLSFYGLKESWSVLKYRYKANFEKHLISLTHYTNPNSTISIRSLFSNASGASAYVNIAVEVLIAAILAMITTLIGVQLIGPVATAVGGALKNGNLTGAANSVTAQLTLLFVVVIVLVPIVFIAVFGKIVSAEAS